MTTNNPTYSRVAIILHWLIACALIFQIVLGLRMDEASGPSTYAIFQLHKSIGITILVLSLGRLAWRLTHRAPAHDPDMPRLERLGAHLTHVGFYVVMIGMPLTGWALVSASRINIPTVLYSTIPWPHLPFISGLNEATKATWEQWSTIGHEALAYLAYALIALHIGAVIKHQWLDKQPLLARMTGKGRAGLTEPRLWIALGALALCVGAGYLYAPAPKATAPIATEEKLDTQDTVTVPAISSEVAEPASVEAATDTDITTANNTAHNEAAAIQPVARWDVQKAGAVLGFATSWSGEAIEGRFGDWNADIRFSPDLLDESRINITINTRSASTGDAQRDSTLPGTDFFDTSSHPDATFSARKIRRTAPNAYVADGTLTLRGVSRPLSLPFRLNIDGDKAHASGSVALDRTLFGVGQGMYADTASIPAMVRVSFNFDATRVRLRTH